MDDYDSQDFWDDAEEFEKDQLARDADYDRAEDARQRALEDEANAAWGEEEHQRRLAEEEPSEAPPTEVDWF